MATVSREAPMVRVTILLASFLCLAPPVVAEEAVAPVFFALSVADLEASIQWYSDTLQLTPTRLPPSPQTKVALLQGGGLIVELVEHSEAFDLETRLPELRKRYLAHGLFKVGFFVSDLDATVERLKSRGATFKGKLFTDEVLGARSILLLDNSQNIIQLFERAGAK
jgi:Glyoxalase/Bleomycin resistance protein/Dioxygenase superfamily